uniref:Uncharacterized protein n=1 Tax=Romanomermis culicivorax TaxID=13658 RepID=A0A915KXG9_ROMCU
MNIGKKKDAEEWKTDMGLESVIVADVLVGKKALRSRSTVVNDHPVEKQMRDHQEETPVEEQKKEEPGVHNILRSVKGEQLNLTLGKCALAALLVKNIRRAYICIQIQEHYFT